MMIWYKKEFLLLYEKTGWRVQQLKSIPGFLLPESILNASITNVGSFPPIIKETPILNSFNSIFSNAP